LANTRLEWRQNAGLRGLVALTVCFDSRARQPPQATPFSSFRSRKEL
jgi:hypothetical protein